MAFYLLIVFAMIHLHQETIQVEFFEGLLFSSSTVTVRNATITSMGVQEEWSNKTVQHAEQDNTPSPPRNQTLEERFAYAPSSTPLSAFDRKRMSKLPPTSPLKVKTPIVVVSLPKSGTSSIWKFFLCAGHMAAHTYSRANQTTSHRIGHCIENNVKDKQKPFAGCGPYYVWSDIGYVELDNNECFYPSIHALDALYEAYPEMTLLLMRRNSTKWAHSIQKFNFIGSRWANCNADGMPKSSDLKALTDFYAEHVARLRKFAQDHPSVTFLDMPLEGKETAQMLEDAFGAPASCWKNCAPGKKACKEARRRRRL